MLFTMYVLCAVVGGTVLLCQFVLTLLGMSDADDIDAGHDVPHDVGHAGSHGDGAHDHPDAHHDANWFFGIITFRTVIAALTFFGLSGLMFRSMELGQAQPVVGFVLALGIGWGAMYGVHWMMKGLHRLKAEGTARIERSVGQPGSVYLRVPGERSGVGKVTVIVQNRTMEYQAMTLHDALPTGAKIVVVGVVGPDTVEVELAPATVSSTV